MVVDNNNTMDASAELAAMRRRRLEQQQLRQETTTAAQEEANLVKIRERQWMYLGMIMAAPLAHFAVTMYRDAKTPQMKRYILVGGVVGSTCLTLCMRMSLMYHAGYPGREMQTMASDRTLVVSKEEAKTIEKPPLGKLASEAFRGFG